MTMFKNYTFILHVIGVLCYFFSSSSVANEQLAQSIIEKISKSKSELQLVESKIFQESSILSKRLDNQQKNIIKLRNEAGAVQRVADEQLLSVKQLEARLKQWSTQSNYQKQLLTSYIESNAFSANEIKHLEEQDVIDISVLQLITQKLSSKLDPSWKVDEIIGSKSLIEQVNLIDIGPVQLAFNESTYIGGPVINENNEKRIVNGIYNQQEVSELNQIYSTGVGYIKIDPTLGNAYKLLDKDPGLFEHIEKGGLWAIPIIFFGLLSLIVSLLKAIQLVRLPKVDMGILNKLKLILASGSDQESEPSKREKIRVISNETVGAQNKLLNIVINNPISQERDDLLVAYLMEYKHKIDRYLGVITTSAAIAPLLGLLGTVSGMISTFMMMTIFGTGDAATVSGGISEALITTELGLIVAIPSLIISALLSRMTKNYNLKLETHAIKISKLNIA